MVMFWIAILTWFATPLAGNNQLTWRVRGLDHAGGVSGVFDQTDIETRMAQDRTKADVRPNAVIVRYHDGSSEAPNCVAELPKLLTGYAVRPPWKVAGVDYCVGVPGDVSLKDPMTIVDNVTIPGAHREVFGGRNYLVVDGDGVVVDGYDFSLHGGWQVDVKGSNATIKNSAFLSQSSSSLPIYFEASAAGGSVSNCNIDGNNGTRDADGGPLLRIMGAVGTFFIKYNSFKAAYADMIDLGNSTAGVTQSFDIRYNLFHNAGMGTDQQGHPDYVQSFWRRADAVVVNFNTLVQSLAPAQGGSQGLMIGSEVVGAMIQRKVEVSNNTMIALPFSLRGTGREGVYPGMSLASGQIEGTATVSNNYIDERGYVSVNGSPAHWIQILPPGRGGKRIGKVDCFGNTNLLTGGGMSC
jgi:hypothetical protein